MDVDVFWCRGGCGCLWMYLTSPKQGRERMDDTKFEMWSYDFKSDKKSPKRILFTCKRLIFRSDRHSEKRGNRNRNRNRKREKKREREREGERRRGRGTYWDVQDPEVLWFPYEIHFEVHFLYSNPLLHLSSYSTLLHFYSPYLSVHPSLSLSLSLNVNVNVNMCKCVWVWMWMRGSGCVVNLKGRHINSLRRLLPNGVTQWSKYCINVPSFERFQLKRKWSLPYIQKYKHLHIHIYTYKQTFIHKYIHAYPHIKSTYIIYKQTYKHQTCFQIFPS